MAGSTRYLRYILFALVALIIIFFVSSSSSTVDERVKSAADLLRSQGSLWKGSSFGKGQDEVAKKPEPTEVVVTSASSSAAASQETSYVDPAIDPNAGHLTSSQKVLPHGYTPNTRVNATFVTLARNADIWEISRSIRQVEDRFNRNYHYDWVFLNDNDFDEDFKRITSSLVSGRARYGKIGEHHWGFPDFIDQDKAQKVREDMHERKIIYGDSISYRHMCRYESGFFFHHPLMLEYEYYWRVEPSIELFCDIAFDPFRFMQENKKKYSFVLSLYEYVETIPTLWDSVKSFMEKHPEHIAANNSMEFLSDDGGETYNHCHFWSNFEVGSLEWLRSKAYTDYFDSLDHDGGFFYERWGDAPVHSIAAALMLPREEIHFFNDIAYYHVPFTHCPTGEDLRLELKCHCNPKDNFDWNGYSCTNRWYDLHGLDKPKGWDEED